jgi:hypothetical protein
MRDQRDGLTLAVQRRAPHARERGAGQYSERARGVRSLRAVGELRGRKPLWAAAVDWCSTARLCRTGWCCPMLEPVWGGCEGFRRCDAGSAVAGLASQPSLPPRLRRRAVSAASVVAAGRLHCLGCGGHLSFPPHLWCERRGTRQPYAGSEGGCPAALPGSGCSPAAPPPSQACTERPRFADAQMGHSICRRQQLWRSRFRRKMGRSDFASPSECWPLARRLHAPPRGRTALPAAAVSSAAGVSAGTSGARHVGSPGGVCVAAPCRLRAATACRMNGRPFGELVDPAVTVAPAASCHDCAMRTLLLLHSGAQLLSWPPPATRCTPAHLLSAAPTIHCAPPAQPDPT